MAFKDGGTVKQIAAGQGTVPGAPSPINPSAPSVGLGAFQPEIAGGAGTSTTKSGPMQASGGAQSNDVSVGGAQGMGTSTGASGGTEGSGSGSRAIKQRNNSNAPLVRPTTVKGAGVPKGGAAIPKGAPPYNPPRRK